MSNVYDRLQAGNAADKEHNMTLVEGLRRYPKAIMFSAIISLCIIMEGYDTNLLSSFFAFGPFERRYGIPTGDGSYQLPARWQSGLSNGASAGEVIGLLLNGWASERFGYRRMTLGSLAVLCGLIFLLFFANSVEMLEAGEILCGIPWGVFQSLTTVYAAEVCPVNLRAYLTTYVNLCWVLGTMLGQGVLRGFLNDSESSGQWAYRVPFAIQWVWPIPIAIGVLLAPESPWWLIRHGRQDEAKIALRRLQSREYATEEELDATVALMTCTHQLEEEIETGASYLDCFRGVDLRRTEIACMVYMVQNLCGSTFMNYSTYFFQQAGLSEANSFNVAMGQYAMGAVGTISSWFLMACLGRRTIYLIGTTAIGILLLITGLIDLSPSSNTTVPWVIAAMIVLTTFIYDLTVGPVCYCLVTEIPAGRLRTRTVVLARGSYIILSIITNIIVPYMLNPTAWNWSAKSGLLFSGLAFVSLLWSYFRLPEPKGRSFAELDSLFAQGVPARKFKATVIDVFHIDEKVEKADVQHVEVVGDN
jgi:MFS transporter, SP family, general alpha glucoside:H+ symporter